MIRMIKIAIAIILVVILLQAVAWRDVLALLRDAHRGIIALYAIVIMIGNGISVIRWGHLAAVHALRAPFPRLLGYYLTASFINNFLPGFIGGDAYRAYRLANKGDLVPATFSVIADRIVGLFGILNLAAVCGIAWYAITPPTVATARLAIGITILATFIAWGAMFYRMNILAAFARIVPRAKYRHYIAYAAHYTTATILRSALWGALFGAIGVVGANALLFLALGTHPPILPFAFCALIAAIVASLPISIGNVGVKEWAYVFFMGWIGIAPNVAVAAVILGRVTMLLISLSGIVPYFTQERSMRRA